ncbi:MAG: sulfatase-like hydrolase/transferase, partial [Pseudomonadales bacterium]|nr:sulfatase-like hydrolase/transferase [Pseudomonadales bacterium]
MKITWRHESVIRQNNHPGITHRRIKLLLIAILSILVCSCSNDDDFNGDIGKNIGSSTPDFLYDTKAPDQSPNVIILVADDLGYSDIGSYGGEISTPSLDELAANGVRYNHFTVTAVCSSTRAALLTGMNHHSAGTGWLAEWDFGYPGYRGEIHKNSLTLAEILKLNGYSTFMVGKWHLTNADHRSPIGPFDSWPTGRGFEKYFGFLEGEANQFKPHWLVSGNDIHPPPDDENFYLPDAITDKAIDMIKTLRNHDREKP